MQNIFYKISCVLVFLIIFSSPYARGEEAFDSVAPEDVYYLAKSVNDLIISINGLNNVFNKKAISKNIRPGNVFEMALEVEEKLKVIHGRADYFQNEPVHNIMITRHEDVYNLLSRMRNHILEEHDSMLPPLLPFEERMPKTSSDIFQMLRQISFHLDEVAVRRGIATEWAAPAQVYDTTAKKILPLMYGIADMAGIKYDPFNFPVQPVKDILPRNVYKLLYYTYKNVAEYLKKDGYDPIIFEEINDCDQITPSDVFAIAQIISAELSSKTGRKVLSSEAQAQYDKWKAGKKEILPGDVFRLIQYNFILSRKIMKNEENK